MTNESLRARIDNLRATKPYRAFNEPLSIIQALEAKLAVARDALQHLNGLKETIGPGMSEGERYTINRVSRITEKALKQIDLEEL